MHASNTSHHFTTGETGNLNADPYKAANADNSNCSLKEKVEDLIKFAKAVKFCMMTTRQDLSGLLVSRCMAVADVEGGVDLCFHTNTETGKTDEIASDSHVNVAFIKENGEWASISGLATIECDREKVRAHYTPSLKAWVGDLGDGIHDGGPDDPRIAIIKVKAITASYAFQKGNAITRGLEIAKGAVTGSTASNNKLREITEEELKQYRANN
ncbi:hypothetical protein BZA77DRAFT_238139 [Pyronema omphalodes]|nr:hypothetical protein BZA77DRAFT_238139 [Pyronema omphalodes]